LIIKKEIFSLALLLSPSIPRKREIWC